MTMIEKIQFLMCEKNLNKRQFSISSGIPYSTIDNWFKIGCDKMQLPTFRALCDYFGVTMDSMAYDENEIVYKKDMIPVEITPFERDFLHSFRYLDEDGKDRILNSLNYEKDQEREKRKNAAAS